MVLGAEHQMDDDEGEGLRHGGTSMGRAFSPSPCFFCGVPGPLAQAGMGRAFGAGAANVHYLANHKLGGILASWQL